MARTKANAKTKAKDKAKAKAKANAEAKAKAKAKAEAKAQEKTMERNKNVLEIFVCYTKSKHRQNKNGIPPWPPSRFRFRRLQGEIFAWPPRRLGLAAQQYFRASPTKV